MNRRNFLGNTLASIASLCTFGWWGVKSRRLQTKKLMALIKIPNELIKYAMPAEMLFRDDMVMSLSAMG